MPLERLKKKTREELLWPYLLRLLSDSPSYAYELRKEIEENFGWKPPLTTTYTVLYRLERGEYVEGEWKKKGSRPKKYYKITEKGKDTLGDCKKYLKNLQESLFENPDRTI